MSGARPGDSALFPLARLQCDDDHHDGGKTASEEAEDEQVADSNLHAPGPYPMSPDPSKRAAALRALALSDEALVAQSQEEFFVASGPGGQHRNKTSTGVRLTHPATGVTVTATERRSQAQNRSVAVLRLREALEALTYVPRVRRPTRPTRGSQRRRQEGKRKLSEKKRLRRSLD